MVETTAVPPLVTAAQNVIEGHEILVRSAPASIVRDVHSPSPAPSPVPLKAAPSSPTMMQWVSVGHEMALATHPS
jgi:hypothetical protein